MALTTDTRTEIAAALAMAGLPAFPYVPETVTLPSVVVVPDDPYIVVDRLGPTLNYTVAYVLHVVTQAIDNEAGLSSCEALIDDTLRAIPDGVRVVRVNRPLIDNLGAQGSAYVAQIFVQAHVAEAPPVVPLRTLNPPKAKKGHP
jgi:hypothetical protein